MRINLSPMRPLPGQDETLTIIKTGDMLTVNGEAFDLSGIPEGGTLPAGVVPCEWISGAIERVNGELRLTLVLPHGPNPSEAVAFPAPLIDPPDGDLVLPRDHAEAENVEA